MKNKNVNAFCAAQGGKTRKNQKMQIFHHDLNQSVEPDGFALALLNDAIPDWINPALRFDMVDSLAGYNEDVALEIVDNLIDCWSGLGLRTTGLKFVDEILGRFYMRILTCAHNQGIALENKL
jgi:hypothetical protein